MKATTLFALFIALFLLGCGEPPSDSTTSNKLPKSLPKTESYNSIDLDDTETLDETIAKAIDKDNLQKRGKKGEELLYAPNEQTPYTGWAKSMHGNGQIRDLVKMRDGKKDGLAKTWFENGQQGEGNFKDGKQDGVWTLWNENRQKKWEINYKDGKLDGIWTLWNRNGQKTREINYENGQREWQKDFKDGEQLGETKYFD